MTAAKIFRAMNRGPRLLAVFCAALADYLGRIKLRGLDQERQHRQLWMTRWAQRILKVLEIEIAEHGVPPTEGVLVCNHLSYLDIVVLASRCPMTFVSKSEVKSWPLIGWLTRCAGTIFVNRASKADVRRVSLEMNRALRDGGVLGFFPEGTSTDGRALSRFHAPLFSVCENGAALITPAFLRYALEDGEPEKDVCYWGDMTFLPHLLNLLTKRRIMAGVIWGTPENYVENRKTVARRMFEQVSGLRSRALVQGANIAPRSFASVIAEAGSTP